MSAQKSHSFKSERARARLWSRRAYQALELMTHELNQSPIIDYQETRCSSDPLLLLLSVMITRLGERWGLWSSADPRDESRGEWSDIATLLSRLSDPTSSPHADHTSGEIYLGGLLFGDRTQRLAQMSDLMSAPSMIKLGELLDLSSSSPQQALNECTLFYEGLLDYRCHLDPETSLFVITKSVKRKRSGAHFTPRLLARDVALGALDIKRSHGEAKPLSQLRICDPSAGIGALLLEVSAQLAYLISGGSGELQAESGSYQDAVRQVTMSCLYGVELNPWSSELARLFLWIHAGGGSEVLIALRDHLKTGDALELLPEQTASSIGAPSSSPPWWGGLFWETPEPLSISALRFSSLFDIVIGNPPYVAFYGRGSQAKHYPDDYLRALKSRPHLIDQSSILGGRLNLFLSFCALAHQLATPQARARGVGGVVSLILPDSVLTNESYEPLRRALTQSGHLKSVTLYDDPIFSGATVGASVISWDRVPSLEREVTLRRDLHRQALGVKQSHSQRSAPQAITSPTSEHEEWIESPAVIAQRPRCSWYPTSSVALKADLVSDESTTPLEEVALIRDGFNTGTAQLRALYLSREVDAKGERAHRSGGDLPTLFNPIPCLEGKLITPHRLKESALQIRLPTSTSQEKLSIYHRAKLVYRQTANRPIAAVDLRHHCYLNSAHAVLLKETALTDQALREPALEVTVLYALCAYLNSDRCARYYQAFSGELRATFPQIHVSTMRQLRAPTRIFNPHDSLTVELAQLARALSGESADSADQRDPALHKRIESLITLALGEVPPRQG